MNMTWSFDLFCRVCRMLAWSVLLLLAFGHPAWSAITFVNSTWVVSGPSGANSVTLAYPAGIVVDDVLVAQIAAGGNQGITAPAGWMLINRTNNGNSLTQATYWKRASASNPVSDIWSFGSSARAAGTIVAYRGVDPVAPVNVYSVRTNASSSITADSLTPTVSATQLLGLYAIANGNAGFTPPAGMAEREDHNTGAGPNGITIELADEAYTGGTAATGARVAAASKTDGSVAHLIALQPNVIANYRMDETAWTSAAGQVLDSSGRGYLATAFNGATTSGTVPAIAGNPGTCNYGQFDGSNDYVGLPASFPDLTTDFTLTAWIRTNSTKGGQRIFIDDQNNTGGYGFSLGDGGPGKVRFYTRAVNPVILDTPSVIQNNTWYFVAAVADIGAKTKSIYVYNQAGIQLAYVTQTYTGTWGTDAGDASMGGENNASTESGSNFKFSGNLDEVSVFSGALGAVSLSQVMNQTRPCSGVPVVAPSGFNAFESGTPTGSADGKIHTKVSASAFNLAVVALKAGGMAVEPAFAGDVKLELVDASAGAGCSAYGLIRNLGTLSFTTADLGRKTLAGISEPNAWPNARIRMSYPATGAPTIVACSTDNFAIRPASFGGVVVSDDSSVSAGATRTLANTGVSGGNVHKAGQPFQIVATAHNAAGAATSNYNGSPAASLTACVLPATGCTLGGLSPGAWTAVSGTLTTTSARYSEVGAFAMKLVDTSFAAVDAADGSSAAERTIESAVVNVGRFVPDHFDLLPSGAPPVFKTFNEVNANCPAPTQRSFTYVGQPFGYLTLPQATITAKNAAGSTTLNYAGALWKLVAAGAVQTHTATHNLDIGLLGVPTVSASGGGTGILVANAADEIAFVRTIPVAPFIADISLSMSIEDISENGVTDNGIVATASPVLFSNIAFDAVNGNEIRFGQLVLTNAHGSELLGLPVPIETRYWNGSGFALNAADSCTQLAAANVALSNWQRNLNAPETAVTLGGRFNAGRGNLRLSAPGAGNTGSVDLTVQLGAAAQSWLQGHWSNATPGYDQDPAARASFGLHRGSKPLIYLREMY